MAGDIYAEIYDAMISTFAVRLLRVKLSAALLNLFDFGTAEDAGATGCYMVRRLRASMSADAPTASSACCCFPAQRRRPESMRGRATQARITRQSPGRLSFVSFHQPGDSAPTRRYA